MSRSHQSWIPAERNRPLRVVARFESTDKARAACQSVNKILTSAGQEFDALLSRQNGQAEAIDVAQIFARYGLRNDVGWTQERPLVALETELLWEVPYGLVLEDAEAILWAFGAEQISIHTLSSEAAWRHTPLPTTGLPPEEEELLSLELDDDLTIASAPAKKLLH